jgi:hypothetical protein
MRSIYSFIIEPKEGRYNNKKKVGDKELILNSTIEGHNYVSRNAIVKGTPIAVKTDIKEGDEILVHHNVFRRYNDIRGEEKDSSNKLLDNKFFCFPDQVYLYKRKEKWEALKGYCFVKPIKNKNRFTTGVEQPLVGVLKYIDKNLAKNGFKVGDLVGFTPESEYEFVVDNERLYRVLTNQITIKYEYQGDEEEYNPSWLSGS